MRCFVAVDLPDPLRDALVRVQGGLRTGRIVPEDNLHLTLAFLGDVEEDAVEALHDALSGIHTSSLAVSISGIDIFGSPTAPRLVCAVVPDTPALTALHDDVIRAARKAGITLQRRKFRPHVTLARFGKTARADAGALAHFLNDHAALTLPTVHPLSFGVYASTLRPDGAEYELISSYPLV